MDKKYLVKHKGFVIQPQGDSFQILPNSAGKALVFWVVNKQKNIRSIFAVARSLTDSFAHTGQSEDNAIEELISLVKDYIDRDKVKDLEEYTFEYENGQLVSKDNPSWWKKTLNQYFSK